MGAIFVAALVPAGAGWAAQSLPGSEPLPAESWKPIDPRAVQADGVTITVPRGARPSARRMMLPPKGWIEQGGRPQPADAVTLDRRGVK